MNQARVTQPMAEVLFERADGQEILGRPGVAGATRRERWQARGHFVGQLTGVPDTAGGIHFETHEAGQL